jgi:hypothetical protein
MSHRRLYGWFFGIHRLQHFVLADNSVAFQRVCGFSLSIAPS